MICKKFFQKLENISSQDDTDNNAIKRLIECIDKLLLKIEVLSIDVNGRSFLVQG